MEDKMENNVDLGYSSNSETQSGNATHGENHHGGHHHSGHYHRSDHHGGHHRGSHRHRSKHEKHRLNTKVILMVAISLIVLLMALVIVFEVRDFRRANEDSQQSGEISSDVLSVKLINEKGLLIRNAVQKYLQTDLLNPKNAEIIPSSFSDGEGRLDEQVPVALKLSVKEGFAIAYKIEFADNAKLDNAKTAYINADSGVYEFKHLCANTTYFYRVTVYTSKGDASVEGSFTTADTPRILSIDGLSNVRDIGNWKTDSGKRIKQGLLIRGTEMDAAVESGYHLTNEGLADMLNVFGIKTDMDLRAQTSTSKDALGSRVNHKYYAMVQYDGIFTDYGKEKVKMVFADLANPDNYPIYLHCTAGCDRTGTICYLLEALLGVSRGDCLKDYALSNLASVNIRAMEEGLKAYEGDTLKQQVESYLLSCGVSEHQIESIRNIFLGD